MKIGHFKIHKVIPNEDGSLTLSCLTATHIELKTKVPSFTFDSGSTDMDTWTKVARYVVNTFTNLNSYMIDIKDKFGVQLPSEDHEWSNVTVLDLLNDIADFTNSYIYINKSNLIRMGTFETANLSKSEIIRGKNIISNNATKTTTELLNYINASFNIVKTNKKQFSFEEQRNNAISTQTLYAASRFFLPSGIQEISSIRLEVARYQTSPVIAPKVKLMHNPANQTTPPSFTSAPSTKATITISSNDVGPELQWYEYLFSPFIDVNAINNSYWWIVSESTSPSSNFLIFGASTEVPADLYYLSSNGTTWFPSSPTKSFRHIGFGNSSIIVSGVYSDQNSIDEYGKRQKNIIAKRARSDDACYEYAKSVVNFSKNELIDSQVSTPFTNIRPGQRVLLHDPAYDIFYENLFVSSVNYSNTNLMITLTQPDLNLVEISDDTDKELFTSDNLSFV